MSIQIVVVTCNEERKQRIQRQIAELGIPYKTVYINGATPTNSKDYIPSTGMSDKDIRAICCSLSHIRAINCAAEDSSPDFSLIVEDDVAFHRTAFLPMIQRIVDNWDSYMGTKSKMLSVGWIPYRNYSHYLIDTYYSKSIESGYKLLHCYYYGAQAYIIKKRSAQEVSSYINAPTYDTFVQQMLASKLPDITKDTNFIHADLWINRMFTQVALFPLLAIEQKNNVSILGDHNPGGNEKVWTDFFKQHESEREQYWSYPM